MNELALFAGAGGGILGGHLLGWRTVAAVEIEDFPRAVLLQRQADGLLPRFPIWDDVRTFDGEPWKGRDDVISGGFPCTDISVAGKGAGITGEKSGLWKEMARIIGEVRPRFVFVENSPVLTSRGLGDVLGDLSEMGYNAEWGVLGAHHAGAPHKRDRIWVLAYTGILGRSEGADFRGAKRKETRRGEPSIGSEALGDTISERLEGYPRDVLVSDEQGRINQEPFGPISPASIRWWEEDPAERDVKPGMGRMAHGIPDRVDRIKALGNAQVPAVAAIAWNLLYKRIKAVL